MISMTKEKFMEFINSLFPFGKGDLYVAHKDCIIDKAEELGYISEKPINSGYPLLADVLAEIDKELRAFGIVLDPDDLPRKIIKGVLSKYFS